MARGGVISYFLSSSLEGGIEDQILSLRRTQTHIFHLQDDIYHQMLKHSSCQGERIRQSAENIHMIKDSLGFRSRSCKMLAYFMYFFVIDISKPLMKIFKKLLEEGWTITTHPCSVFFFPHILIKHF